MTLTGEAGSDEGRLQPTCRMTLAATLPPYRMQSSSVGDSPCMYLYRNPATKESPAPGGIQSLEFIRKSVMPSQR